MKRLTYLLPIILVAFSSCEESAEMRAQLEHAVEQAREAGAAAGEYSESVRKDLAKKFEEELVQMDHRLQELRLKAKAAQKEAQPQIDEQLKNLEIQRDKAGEQLKKLSSESQEAWGDFKIGFEKAMHELNEGFSKASENFK